MEIIKTESKYWLNGLHKRGFDFYTVAFKISKYDFLFSVSVKNKHLGFGIYKLTNF